MVEPKWAELFAVDCSRLQEHVIGNICFLSKEEANESLSYAIIRSKLNCWLTFCRIIPSEQYGTGTIGLCKCSGLLFNYCSNENVFISYYPETDLPKLSRVSLECFLPDPSQRDGDSVCDQVLQDILVKVQVENHLSINRLVNGTYF